MEKPKQAWKPSTKELQKLALHAKNNYLNRFGLQARRNTTLVMDVISTLCMVVVVFGFLCFTYLYINHTATCSTGSLISDFSIGDTIMFTLCEPPLMQEDLINPQSWTDPSE